MDLLRSLPLGLYLEQPVTWLHRLDPRVKLLWLMTFLFAPLLATPYWRLTLVVILISLTLSARIPIRAWKQQMGWLLILGTLVFIITCLAPDALGASYQPRLPDSDLQLPNPTSYQYRLFNFSLLDLRNFSVTRRSLDLAVRVSTLVFTLIYSTTLFLLTTAPEEIASALEFLMQPLRRLRLPVTEIVLTMTLSLRFIPLVLEEVQNLARSVRTRAINWKKLGLRRSGQLWVMVAEKLLENLLLRAEQTATAMNVRGFTSPNEHRVLWHSLKLRWWDWLAIAAAIVFWSARLFFGGIEAE
jgi:energy-coupling factor transport system permease protein